MIAGFLFKEYEVNNRGVVTGYKIIFNGEQIATMEYRNDCWIGAVTKDIKIMTKLDSSVMRLADWIINESV